jgi:hypothetical protein
MREKRVGHDTEDSEVSLLLDSSFTDIAHCAPAIVQRAGKRGKIVLALNELASFIYHLYVQHLGHEKSKSPAKRRASATTENVITILPTHGIAPDIEAIASRVCRLHRNITR